jgi:hypothetical protein
MRHTKTAYVQCHGSGRLVAYPDRTDRSEQVNEWIGDVSSTDSAPEYHAVYATFHLVSGNTVLRE